MTRAITLWARRAAALAVVAAMLAGAAVWLAARWMPDRTAYPAQGAVLSPVLGTGDGPYPWGQIKAAGADFAYLTATSGVAGWDRDLDAERAGAALQGISTGVIHHYDLCQLATDQAANFIRHVPRSPPPGGRTALSALPAAIWVDANPACAAAPSRALLVSELTTFLAQIEQHLGQTALLAPSAAVQRDYDLVAAIARPFWLRRNFLAPDAAGPRWDMWLASTHVRINGVGGTVGWTVIAPTPIQPAASASRHRPRGATG